LPGMQAAFVDIGLERTAFLHVGDIADVQAADDTIVLPTVDDIRKLVSPGDDILVQVIKDPLGTKGARLTTFIALPSRYLVYMPRGDGIGVSARIDDESERQRLKQAVASFVAPNSGGGYILRTASQGVSLENLREDMGYLDKLWRHVRLKATETQPGAIVHEDLPLPVRILRDELSRGVSRVLVDSPREHAQMLAFAAAFMPDAAARNEL
jgi:ribonuclease G